MRIGIVAEGTSDFILLEVVMQKIHGPHPIEFVRVWPELTLTSRRGFGWRGVKNWCEEFGSQLSVFMQGVKGKELDLFVIHVDCSMADKVGAGRSCPPAKDTADALRDVVLYSWLGLTEAQPMVLIVTPAQSTDAWVVAALNPPYSRLASIECNKGVEAELVARHLLRKKDGEVKKPSGRYRPLALRAAEVFEQVCKHCSEADRFREEFRAAATFSILCAAPEL